MHALLNLLTLLTFSSPVSIRRCDGQPNLKFVFDTAASAACIFPLIICRLFDLRGFNMLPEAQRELEKSKYTLKFMYDVPPDVGGTPAL